MLHICALNLSALLVACTPDPLGIGEPLAQPNDGAYWFEMQNLMDGQWEPVILVFGYVDDRAVCDWMISVGHEQNPGRRFRCTAVAGSVIHFP